MLNYQRVNLSLVISWVSSKHFQTHILAGDPFWRANFQQLSLVVISRGSNRNGQPTTRGAISSQLQWQKGNMSSPCHCRPDIRPWVISLHVSRATTHCQSVWSCLIQWDFALQKLHVPWSRVGFSTHGTTSILETSGCPLPGTACWSFGQCQKGLLSKKQRTQFPAWDGMTIADMAVRGEKKLNPNRHFLMIEYLEKIWRYISRYDCDLIMAWILVCHAPLSDPTCWGRLQRAQGCGVGLPALSRWNLR